MRTQWSFVRSRVSVLASRLSSIARLATSVGAVFSPRPSLAAPVTLQACKSGLFRPQEKLKRPCDQAIAPTPLRPLPPFLAQSASPRQPFPIQPAPATLRSAGLGFQTAAAWGGLARGEQARRRVVQQDSTTVPALRPCGARAGSGRRSIRGNSRGAERVAGIRPRLFQGGRPPPQAHRKAPNSARTKPRAGKSGLFSARRPG